MPEEEFLVPLETYLKAGLHIGTKYKTKYMEPFIYKARPDGLLVLNVQEINSRLKVLANFLSQYKPEDIIVAARRENAWYAVNKFSKTYYAHWSTSVVGKDGRLKSIGKKKELGSYEIPLEEIKTKLRKNIDTWKENSKRVGAAAELTVGDLVKAFIKNGTTAQDFK